MLVYLIVIENGSLNFSSLIPIGINTPKSLSEVSSKPLLLAMVVAFESRAIRGATQVSELWLLVHEGMRLLKQTIEIDGYRRIIL